MNPDLDNVAATIEGIGGRGRGRDRGTDTTPMHTPQREKKRERREERESENREEKRREREEREREERERRENAFGFGARATHPHLLGANHSAGKPASKLQEAGTG